MSRLVSFNINSSPIPISILDKKILEKENEIRLIYNEYYNDGEFNKFFLIFKNSIKSSKTIIIDEMQSYAWSDELYLQIYDAIGMQCYYTIIKQVNDIKIKKFNDVEIPINYLTSIIRSSIDKKQKLFKFIEDDLNNIRSYFKENCKDKFKIQSHLPPRFIELNIKVNRNTNLDSETKKLLNKEINNCHKKVQEWIQKN